MRKSAKIHLGEREDKPVTSVEILNQKIGEFLADQNDSNVAEVVENLRKEISVLFEGGGSARGVDEEEYKTRAIAHFLNCVEDAGFYSVRKKLGFDLAVDEKMGGAVTTNLAIFEGSFDPRIQNMLAGFYLKGIGVRADLEKARQRAETALANDHLPAASTLIRIGKAHFDVEDASRSDIPNSEDDKKSAFICYQVAAEKNNLKALYLLGVCYENGCGVSQNPQLAKEKYRMAAEREYLPAQVRLAAYSRYWISINQDHAESLKYYAKTINKSEVARSSFLSFDPEPAHIPQGSLSGDDICEAIRAIGQNGGEAASKLSSPFISHFVEKNKANLSLLELFNINQTYVNFAGVSASCFPLFAKPTEADRMRQFFAEKFLPILTRDGFKTENLVGGKIDFDFSQSGKLICRFEEKKAKKGAIIEFNLPSSELGYEEEYDPQSNVITLTFSRENLRAIVERPDPSIKLRESPINKPENERIL